MPGTRPLTRARRSTAFAATGLALTLLLAAACGDDDDDDASATAADSADAAGGEGGAVECPDGRVRFGVEPYEDPAQLTPAYDVLAGALERELGCPVEMQIVEDYSAEVLAMENGELEVAQFGPLGFVFANQRADAEPIASFGDAEGNLSTYTAGIWVPADSEIESIEDLEGTTLALSSPGSTSGDALPRSALDAGIAEADVELQYAGGHPEALLALTNGQVDAAEINSQQLATATGEGQFDEADHRKIWESDPIPNDPITVAGGLDQDFRDAVREALLNLSPEDVAAVGAFLDVDPPGPMVEVDVATYQPLFDLAESLDLTQEDV